MSSTLGSDLPVFTRRDALRRSRSRRALLADARRQAHLARGKSAFVWQDRALPVGLPLGAAAGMVAWHRRRQAGVVLAAIAGTIGAIVVAAEIEWQMMRRAGR